MSHDHAEGIRKVSFGLWMAAALLCLGTLGAGCGSVPLGEGEPTDTTSVVTTSSATGPGSSTTVEGTSTTLGGGEEKQLQLSVYLCGPDEKLWPVRREVADTAATGKAAVEALLEGPTAAEEEADLGTCIPDGTTFLGLDVQDGVATVDLSQEYASGGGSLSMGLRLAQVIFTLTQFPEVQAVRFQLDGETVDTFGGEGIIIDRPVGRAEFEDSSPAILVESPAFGDTVASPVRVWGSANVYEAVFQLNIVDWDGKIVAEETVTASSGTGTRGTFDVTVPFSVDMAGRGALIVFVYSAKDGSQVNVREIPLTIEK